jgi:hypothetical protein
LHFNVTPHPTAAWTLQQLREALGDGDFRYLLHDRDNIFARRLDESIKNLGMTVLRSPPHSLQANAICERVIRTIRRECLDWLIPLLESHLRSMLKVWVTHYHGARPHMALGPGVPNPPSGALLRVDEKSRHHLGARTVLYCQFPLNTDPLFSSKSDPLGKSPSLDAGHAARALGIDPSSIVVHNEYQGGDFGRRSGMEHTTEAVLVAKATGRAVKVVWTREEDLRVDQPNGRSLSESAIGRSRPR